MDANSLPKNVIRQRRDCDLNPGPSAPESSTLTTRLPSHLHLSDHKKISVKRGSTDWPAGELGLRMAPAATRRRRMLRPSAPDREMTV